MKKRLVILGAGESGTGAALLGKAKGYDVFVSDQGQIQEKYVYLLYQHEISFEEGLHSEAMTLNADLVVKSPGIPDSAPLIVKMREKGISVISEIEFAARYSKAKYVAITGSNGKTTTTLLTYHLLKALGLNVGLAGNIGDSLARQVIEDRHEWYVLELSSFQLDNMYDFKADIAILLNISKDHLDRYDYNFDNYVKSKFRILQNMTEKDQFIFFADDPVISAEIKKKNIGANQFPISITGKVSNGAYMKGDKLVFNLPALDKYFDLDSNELPLKGKHNMINTMAAVLTSSVLNLDHSNILNVLKTFANASHRLEEAGEVNDILFVNDSKATNVDSVWYALDSFDSKIVWIAGGIDKGNDYSQIDSLVKNKVKALVCLGKDNTKLHKFFDGKVEKIVDTDGMEAAVNNAFKLADKGDVVLLSPACASFDLFSNYEDRGEQFKMAVKNLINSTI